MLAKLLEAIFEAIGFEVDGKACEAEVWEQVGSLGLTDECELETTLWHKGKKHKVEYLLQVEDKLVDPEVEQWEKSIDLLAVSVDEKRIWDLDEEPVIELEWPLWADSLGELTIYGIGKTRNVTSGLQGYYFAWSNSGLPKVVVVTGEVDADDGVHLHDTLQDAIAEARICFEALEAEDLLESLKEFEEREA